MAFNDNDNDESMRPTLVYHRWHSTLVTPLMTLILRDLTQHTRDTTDGNDTPRLHQQDTFHLQKSQLLCTDSWKQLNYLHSKTYQRHCMSDDVPYDWCGQNLQEFLPKVEARRLQEAVLRHCCQGCNCCSWWTCQACRRTQESTPKPSSTQHSSLIHCSQHQHTQHQLARCTCMKGNEAATAVTKCSSYWWPDCAAQCHHWS